MKVADFTLTARPHGKAVWLHHTKPVWIAEYTRAGSMEMYYQAYVATVAVPEGLKPWDVASRRLGDPIHGFKTLRAALRAGEAAC